MQIKYPADRLQNPLHILRKAGYQHFIDPVTKKESWIIRLTSGFYPRFHLYLSQKDGNFIFNLHLDQKKASYKGTSAHGGEYDGPTVEKEMNRIADWVAAETGLKKQSAQSSEIDNQKKKIETEPINEDSNNLFQGIF